MVLTLKEYCKSYKFGGKEISTRSLLRRIQQDMLPRGHIPKQINPNRGAWVIEIIKE